MTTGHVSRVPAYDCQATRQSTQCNKMKMASHKAVDLRRLVVATNTMQQNEDGPVTATLASVLSTQSRRREALQRHPGPLLPYSSCVVSSCMAHVAHENL